MSIYKGNQKLFMCFTNVAHRIIFQSHNYPFHHNSLHLLGHVWCLWFGCSLSVKEHVVWSTSPSSGTNTSRVSVLDSTSPPLPLPSLHLIFLSKPSVSRDKWLNMCEATSIRFYNPVASCQPVLWVSALLANPSSSSSLCQIVQASWFHALDAFMTFGSGLFVISRNTEENNALISRFQLAVLAVAGRFIVKYIRKGRLFW